MGNASEAVPVLDAGGLAAERQCFRGTAGESGAAAGCGLQPAFRDDVSGEVVPACFADGRPAPLHLLEGLPPAWVARRDAAGRPLAARTGVVCGFLHQGCFYTRGEAAARFRA